MKCVRCASEVPGQAQFCMRCGAPVGGSVVIPAARPRPGVSRGMIAAVVVAVVAIGAAIALGMRLMNPTTKSAAVNAGGPLTEKLGRVDTGGPLTDRSAAAPQGTPQEIIDYLAWLKGMERQRVTINRRLTGEALKLSTGMTAEPLKAQMSDDPSKGYSQVFSGFQEALSEMVAQYQQLSQQVFAKQPPQSCQGLHDKYYEVLTRQVESVQKVSSSFSDAMGGDPSKALDALTQMQGSGLGTPSHDVADACQAADDELAKVCDKYSLHKDFSIRDDSGGSNLIGQ